MLSRPSFISDDTIAGVIAAHWLPDVTQVEYLPWGFGAYHWRVASVDATLFATLDRLAPRHTAASLEAAYAGAAALASGGLDLVCAPLPARDGCFTIDVGSGVLSVTPWLDGRSPTEAEVRTPRHTREVSAALAALHRAAQPVGLPYWAPRVGPEFADELRVRTAKPWTAGPLGERARVALVARQEEITRWVSRYSELADIALTHRDLWVPTHGEPHGANQVLSACGLKLVDWESLALAPRERDYGDLLDAGADLGMALDPAMAELFELDWRLSEIAEYARWFAAPHAGTEDDDTALQDLYAELALPASDMDK
ncbi:phosphotransferase family protein [Streptomyces griseoluteus]|uniref:phosphotransferase family protein n=1 Tax=Streptomyces griseoluteus TaxID=29306 RepID=UPI00382EDC92